MEDKKDRAERLKYLNQEKEKQEERKIFYISQINKLKDLIKSNQKEIKYNWGWIAFHEKSIENHKKRIQSIVKFNEKQDQEKKLDFHIKEIKNHHEGYIKFHKKEIDFMKKEIQLFKHGVKKCDEQIVFLGNKINKVN